MLPDVVDEFAIQNPSCKGLEPLFYSCSRFCNKLGGGLSAGISTMTLQWVSTRSLRANAWFNVAGLSVFKKYCGLWPYIQVQLFTLYVLQVFKYCQARMFEQKQSHAVVQPFLWKSEMFILKCLHWAMCFSAEASQDIKQVHVVMRMESSWHWNCFWPPYQSPLCWWVWCFSICTQSMKHVRSRFSKISDTQGKMY